MSRSKNERWLWIAREMPYPAFAGDRMYTAGITAAVAGAGIDLTMVACEGEGRERGYDDGINYVGVAGGVFNEIRVAITSPLPVNTGIHATPAFQRELEQLLAEDTFSTVVIDSLSSGWVLDLLRQSPSTATTVYLGHNNETAVWQEMKPNATGSLPRRIAVRRNADKVARLEQRLVDETDLVVTLSDHDAQLFVKAGASRPPLVISPGYSGSVCEQRVIAADTPRHVLLVGSFKWAPKRQNLLQLLDVADSLFAEAGIQLDVVGRIPGRVADIASRSLKATTLHGFVDDLRPMFDKARIAIIPEAIGGGFKLKTIDYSMNRVPIAAIDDAVVGAPDELRSTMFLEDSLPALAQRIVFEIDNLDELNHRQDNAYNVARGRFDWPERGRMLSDAVRSINKPGTLT